MSLLLNFMKLQLQLERVRVVRGRDQEPRPCGLFCFTVSTARMPTGAQLHTAGHGVRTRAAAGTSSWETWSGSCGCCAHDCHPSAPGGCAGWLVHAHLPRGRGASERGRTWGRQQVVLALLTAAPSTARGRGTSGKSLVHFFSVDATWRRQHCLTTLWTVRGLSGATVQGPGRAWGSSV